MSPQTRRFASGYRPRNDILTNSPKSPAYTYQAFTKPIILRMALSRISNPPFEIFPRSSRSASYPSCLPHRRSSSSRISILSTTASRWRSCADARAGVRFCHAGMITRPVRERSVDEVLEAAEESIKNTGFEELALLSLSSSDYTHVLELVTKVGEKFGWQTSQSFTAISANRIGFN